jgi:hypothetical protein
VRSNQELYPKTSPATQTQVVPVQKQANVNDYLSTGLNFAFISPYKVLGCTVSGAQRSVENLYTQAASNGYNTGLSVLTKPTGGVLFGTTSFLYPPGGDSEPGFLSFGNNYYTSVTATQHTVS